MIGIDHDNGSDDDLELNNLLLDAARWGELNEVKRLIEEEGLDPNLVDEVNKTLICQNVTSEILSMHIRMDGVLLCVHLTMVMFKS